MQVVSPADAAAFLAAAGPLLDRDPAANNLPLGIAQQLVDHPTAYERATFWVAEHAGEPVGAAMRTPPHPVVIADPVNEEAIGALLERLLVDDPDLPGVTANEPWATRFATAWSAATDARWRVSLCQGVYRLTRVRPVQRPVAGAARRATEADRPLLIAWLDAFADEALTAMIRDDHATERAVDTRLGPGATGGFDLWDVDGRPVSITGWSPIVVGARVGPVYTPPGDRGSGYASALVAHVSARVLADGGEACFLYTDLGNPTSNAIYRRIGYEQIAESSLIVFERD